MISEPRSKILYALTGLAKRFFLLPFSIRLKFVWLSGKDVSENLDFSLYYLGEGESLGYLKQMCFRNGQSQDMGVLPFWELSRAWKRHCLENNVLIVEINRLLGFCIPKGGFQTFAWIKQKALLDSELYQSSKGKTDRKYGRKVRKHKFRFQIAKDIKVVSKFYYEFYVPYVCQKYNENIHLRSIREMQSAVRSGFLLQVFDGEKWVSGKVCSRYGDTLIVLAHGMVGDYKYHLKRGVNSACNCFLMKWAEENSIRTIDYLRARPNLYDGVYEYKRQWGAYPEKDLWPHTSLWLFIPPNVYIPTVLRKQLIWRNDRFIDLGGLMNE